jgi:hypothetical protein
MNTIYQPVTNCVPKSIADQKFKIRSGKENSRKPRSVSKPQHFCTLLAEIWQQQWDQPDTRTSQLDQIS